MSLACAIERRADALPMPEHPNRPSLLDICAKKAAVFAANHDAPFELGSVTDVHGAALPSAILAWASFPCQDLSLAGKMGGIRAKRSGLVWEWLRVIDEMPQRPSILAVARRPYEARL